MAWFERILSNHFEQAGEIKSIYILIDKKSMSKGIAYIEYKNADDARKSIKMFRKSILMNKVIGVFFLQYRGKWRYLQKKNPHFKWK